MFIRSPSSNTAAAAAAAKDRAVQQQQHQEEEDEQDQPQPQHPAQPNLFWTAVFDYEASAEDELSLRKGDVVEVLSKVRLPFLLASSPCKIPLCKKKIEMNLSALIWLNRSQMV